MSKYELVDRDSQSATYYRKNAETGVMTWMKFVRNINGTFDITVKKTQDVEEILELNVIKQNDFTGYGNKMMVQTTAVPLVMHGKLMERCGYQPGHGYDEKQYKKILNDADYRKLKTIPGKL